MSAEEGAINALEKDVLFMETSAKRGSNIDELFRKLTAALLESGWPGPGDATSIARVATPLRVPALPSMPGGTSFLLDASLFLDIDNDIFGVIWTRSRRGDSSQADQQQYQSLHPLQTRNLLLKGTH
ncbi:MAG: hypothetical protein P4L87_25605 [Formivibrio sp.]|nr:hypothetical protein [Formivibrio sp.]